MHRELIFDEAMTTATRWKAECTSIDHAAKSRGSVHAMLHGYGDGREKKYERFVKYHRRSKSNASDLDLLLAYERLCKFGMLANLLETSHEIIGFCPTTFLGSSFIYLILWLLLPEILLQ